MNAQAMTWREAYSRALGDAIINKQELIIKLWLIATLSPPRLRQESAGGIVEGGDPNPVEVPSPTYHSIFATIPT